jgi:crotonobetainyl-CoA:carnitine CoA-transferase CaiB-like acyl-CoA transferase
MADGRSLTGAGLTIGANSVCVDLKTPEGAAIVRELARSVDVITENYSPGVLPGYGLEDPRWKNSL